MAWPVGDSSTSPDFTYADSSYMCVRQMFVVHMVFSYVSCAAGFLAFVTRCHPVLKPGHVWCGRVYIITMLWNAAVALLIIRHGLPTGTIISFLWVLLGMTIAWFIIHVHMILSDRQATRAAALRIKQEGLQGDLGTLMAAEKARIAASKTFAQRFFSIKAAHGMLMFMSWINIAGRVFITKPDFNNFVCYSQPVFKQMDSPAGNFSGEPLTFLPAEDPDIGNAPWVVMGNLAWGLVMSLGMIAGAAVVGLIWSGAAAALAAKRRRSQAAPLMTGDLGAPGRRAAAGVGQLM